MKNKEKCVGKYYKLAWLCLAPGRVPNCKENSVPNYTVLIIRNVGSRDYTWCWFRLE